MEIENKNIASISPQQSGPAKSPQPGGGPGAGEQASAPPPADTVNITSQAQQLRQLEADIAGQPVVNRERVEAVRQAINEGRFEVDAQRIADRLISLERALNDAS